LRRGEVAGTLPYMAPEQVREETHRLDGRTDIWALGVILYRGLTSKIPFPGRDQAEIFEEILHRDPRPLRMYDPGIDAELERICLCCLSRPMCERYSTAAFLAADLKCAIGELPLPPVPAPDVIVPRGLRPFDVEDARFFLALLPGPRRGDGMPESVRFWKDKIEAVEGEQFFSVGVLYDPSGGGKSSFIRAGLLPNLDRSRVRPIYLDASPKGTESRLLAELRRAALTLVPDANLADAVALLRNGSKCRSDVKLFIVLDQFEQWLQAHPDEPDAELVRALRQCDGRRVQALVLVRDDFWMAVTRFLWAVDIPLVQGGNTAAVELFDARHARKVLEGFGQALGQLPQGGGTGKASLFLDGAAWGVDRFRRPGDPRAAEPLHEGCPEPPLDACHPTRAGECRRDRCQVPERLLCVGPVQAVPRGRAGGTLETTTPSNVDHPRDALQRRKPAHGIGPRRPAGRVRRAYPGTRLRASAGCFDRARQFNVCGSQARPAAARGGG